MNVWVYLDHFMGEALPAAWETLGVGRSLGRVTGLVLGSGVQELAHAACEYGADCVLLADASDLTDCRAEVFTGILSAAARRHNPDLILFPTTTRGRELAAMLAMDLGSGVLVDAISLEVGEAGLLVTRPIYAGKALARERCSARPQIVTLRGRTFPLPSRQPGRRAEILPLEIGSDASLTRVEGYTRNQGGVSLSDAAVIVSGGRGVANNPALVPPAGLDEKQAEIWRAAQGFALLQELADVLGAAVGASRAAVDGGYIPYAHQVGQTGKIVSPDLYIACGISGAIQHLAGMRTSKVIIAINKDAEAPIFKLARYGVVGDLFQVLPALTAALREKLGK